MNNVNKNTELSSEFDWEIYLQCNPTFKELRETLHSAALRLFLLI